MNHRSLHPLLVQKLPPLTWSKCIENSQSSQSTRKYLAVCWQNKSMSTQCNRRPVLGRQSPRTTSRCLYWNPIVNNIGPVSNGFNYFILFSSPSTSLALTGQCHYDYDLTSITSFQISQLLLGLCARLSHSLKNGIGLSRTQMLPWHTPHVSEECASLHGSLQHICFVCWDPMVPPCLIGLPIEISQWFCTASSTLIQSVMTWTFGCLFLWPLLTCSLITRCS